MISAAPPPAHKFATLDAMRGVAAVAVMVFHFRHQFPLGFRRVAGFNSGYLAVDLFFVLSGFVIAYAYDRRFEAGLGPAAFIRMRLIRLLPMIWVGVAIGGAFLLFVAGPPVGGSLAAIVLNAAGLAYPFGPGGALFPANGAQWSLFYELVANCVLALAFPLLRGRGLHAVVLASAAALLWCAYTYGRLQHGWTLGLAHVGFARVGYSFFLGVALWRTRAWWGPRTPVLPSRLILAATAAALLVPAPTLVRPWYDALFVLFASPILVMLASATEPGGADGRRAVALGLVSYPLYAFHQPVRDFARALGPGLPIPSSVLAVLTMAACVVAAWWLATGYDPRVRGWLTRRFAPAPAVGR